MAGYRIIEIQDLPSLLAALPKAMAALSGDPAAWQSREVSDGNMNRVFLVSGPAGSVAVKQALPFIRAVPDWAFPLERIRYEARALRAFAQAAPGSVPDLLHQDEALELLVMEGLTRHRVWRGALVEGLAHPAVPGRLGRDLARIHHAGSLMGLGPERLREAAASFGSNAHLTATTAEVIFTGPMGPHPLNRWTSPELDVAMIEITGDADLTRALAVLKEQFLTRAECLIHGDLHTGSVMVAADPAEDLPPRIFDPEWAFQGPAGFDLGALLGNLLLAWFSQPGHARVSGERRPMQRFCAAAIEGLWESYAAERLARWADPVEDPLLPHRVLPDPQSRSLARQAWIARLWRESQGYAGAKMIRRILGISHVADFEAIADRQRRAACEAAALRFARRLVLEGFGTVQRLTGAL